MLQEVSITKVNLIQRKEKHINMLNKEIQYKRIEEQLKTPNIKKIVKEFEEKIEKEICEANPIAFWSKKKMKFH